MSEILVTGGAGYIGSHLVRLLSERGYTPIVYDNLSTGNREFVRDFELINGDIGDYEKLVLLFKRRDIDCVINFASFIAVGESVQFPLKYYDNNVSKTINLFRAMIDTDIKRFIFSSSAAVYGNPESIPVSEESRLNPTSPYGRTKLFIEKILRDLDISDKLRSVALRYFNAAGAHSSGDIGENHIPETHLIPLVLRAVLDPDFAITIYGTDYDTPDGTCIRDYIHVTDLADAHILAMERLIKQNKSDVFNLGNGRGFSVREVIESAGRITGKKLRVIDGQRRPGDPSILVASSQKAMTELGWSPEYVNLDQIMETAWAWESGNRRR